MITDVIYIVQQEYLRTIKGTDRNYKIWCASENVHGYTSDYIKAEKETERLNSENNRDDVRYVITEVEKLI